jgi:hypothetical protein
MKQIINLELIRGIIFSMSHRLISRPNQNHQDNGGYIGLLVILITFMIIAILMYTEYDGFGFLKSNEPVNPNGSIATGNSFVPASNTPLGRALDAKNTIEAHNKSLLEQ